MSSQGQRLGSRQGQGPGNPAYMSQKQFEQQLKQQIEERQLGQMSDQIVEKRQILEHYRSKLSGLGQKGGGGAANPERGDLQELIRLKEREVAKYDALLQAQKAVVQAASAEPGGASSGLPIADMNMIQQPTAPAHRIPDFQNGQDGTSSLQMPEQFQRPQYLVGHTAGPVLDNYGQNAARADHEKGDQAKDAVGRGLGDPRALLAQNTPNLMSQNPIHPQLNQQQNITNMNNINGGNFQNQQPSGFQGFPVGVPPTASQPQAGAQGERERRLRLREQERRRRNDTQGEEGLSYGAAQSVPAHIIRPQEQMQGASIFGERGGAPSEPPAEINQRDQIWQQKMLQKMQAQDPGPSQGQPPLQLPIHQHQQQLMQLQLPSSGGMPPQQTQFGGPPPSQVPSGPNQYQAMQAQHLQQQIQKIHNAYGAQQDPRFENRDGLGSLNDRAMANEGFQNERGRQDLGHGQQRENPMRRSSKSKLNWEQAKELDNSLNQNPASFHNQKDMNTDNQDKLGPKSSQNEGNGGFLQIGQNDLDQRRRDMDKRQRQEEYSKFLEKQRQEKAMKQLSPGRLKERINSAKQFSNFVDNGQSQQAVAGLPPQQVQYGHNPDQPPASPNKSRRNLVRSNSSMGGQRQADAAQFNILGQLKTGAQQPQGANFADPTSHAQQAPILLRPGSIQNHQRAGSAARAQPPPESNPNSQMLIGGGLAQIGDPETKQHEEKLRKQREYREFLDMQKNQSNLKPPMSASKAPTGQNQNSNNFIAQSKSIKDEAYIQDRRRIIGDQVFNDLLSSSRPGSSHGQPPQQNQVQDPYHQLGATGSGFMSQRAASQQRRLSSAQASNTPSRGERSQAGANENSGGNLFFKNQIDDNQQKQKQADKQKEYALELQRQIEQKKSSQLPPKTPGSQRGHHQPSQASHQQQKDLFGEDPLPLQVPDSFQQPFGRPPIQQMPLPDGAFQSSRPVDLPIPSFQNPLMQPGSNFDPSGQQALGARLGVPAPASHDPSKQPTSFPGMHEDERFQEILRRKREEYRMELEEQMRQKGEGQAIRNAQAQLPAPTQGQGPEISEAEQRRLQREEYKRLLDDQVQQKEKMDQMKYGVEISAPPLGAPGAAGPYEAARAGSANHQHQAPYPVTQHALPQGPPETPQDGGPQAHNRAYNQGGRNRTDITAERNQESDAALQKKLAYQEELKVQMEEQQKKKEAEKARKKREDEDFDKELELQREKLDQKEHNELVNEGKRDMSKNNQARKQVDRSQFETSDERAERLKREKLEEATAMAAPVQQKDDVFENKGVDDAMKDAPVYKPFTIPTASDSLARPKEIIPIYEGDLGAQGPAPGFSMPPPLPFRQEQEAMLPRALPPQGMLGAGQGLGSAPPQLMIPPTPTQPPDQSQSSIMQDKLLEDQQKMIGMYQQALGQILDFRNQYFKEAMDMQMNLMKEREKMFAYQGMQMQQQQVPDPNPGPFGAPADPGQDYNKQQMEINKLQAVKDQLGILMNKATTELNQNANAHQNFQNFTPVMNPQVQNNLNELIKTQRHQIIRLSTQGLSFKQQNQGNNDGYPDRNTGAAMAGNRDDGGAGVNFDESLSSNSKLIRVPNSQFTNKLKEKAENFELQRLQNVSPSMVGGDYNMNQPNISGFDHAQHNQSPSNQHGAPSAGLYNTWKQGGESASTNGRVIKQVSPTKAPAAFNANNPLQASLAGSSHLQFMNNSGNAGLVGETPNQERMFSPIPQQNKAPGLQNYNMKDSISPSRQFNRPATNLVHPSDTIQELPEKEQNMDNTNDYSEDEIRENANIIRNQSEQQKSIDRILHVQKTKQSIETEQDFNNRDEEMQMSQYSKSMHGRKSKVSQVSKYSRANTNQIEQNLNFIENHVNLAQGRNYAGINSNSKSPFSSAFNQERKSGVLLSPGASGNQMINIGQALAGAGQAGQPAIPTNTEKSFFKHNNVNQSHMANTGMAGAPKPTVTGSSFYNATMAKTKLQEQNQQEELQRQLMKIFSTGSSPHNSNVLEHDQRTQALQTLEPVTEDENVQSYGQNEPYQLPLDNTQDFENMSNINIAQSVVQSMDMKVDQEQHQRRASTKNAETGQSNIIDQQYNWLMKNNIDQNNEVINEQEFESKSRSREEEEAQSQPTSVPPSQYQTSRSKASNFFQDASGTERPSQQRQENAPLSRPQDNNHDQTIKQSEAIWDDPDLVPTTSEQYDQIDENDDQQEFEFAGTNASHQQFEVIQEYEPHHNTQQYDPNQYQDQIDHSQSQAGRSRKNWLQKPGTAGTSAQPYTFDGNEEEDQSQVPSHLRQSQNQSQNYDPYNIALASNDYEAEQHQQNPNQIQNQFQQAIERSDAEKGHRPDIRPLEIQANGGGMRSGISGLNLGAGLYSEQEPSTALIVQQDKELHGLKKCSPSQNNLQFQIMSDSGEQEQRNQQIDDMYEMRNSQQDMAKHALEGQLTSVLENQQRPPQNVQDEEIRYGSHVLDQGPIEQSSDIYPPQRRPYNPNFREEEMLQDQIKSPQVHQKREGGANEDPYANARSPLQGAGRTRSRDPILDSTPNGTPLAAQESLDQSQQMQQTSGFNPNLEANTEALTTERLEKMTPGQRNLHRENKLTTESYKQQVEEKFEESLQNKLDKINNIFHKDAAQGDPKPRASVVGQPEIQIAAVEERQESLEIESAVEFQQDQPLEIHERQASQTPDGKGPHLQLPAKELPGGARPQTNVVTKQQELQELARLIQAATGSINNAVESSQQLASVRFNREPSFRAVDKKRPQPQAAATAQSPASDQTNPHRLQTIEQKIEEDNQNDNQILSDLDMIIHNLEKQQQANDHIQNKFSSNKGFVSQKGDAKLNEQYDQAITESLNLQKQGTSKFGGKDFGASEGIHEEHQRTETQQEGAAASMQTNLNEQLPIINRRAGHEGGQDNDDIKETIVLDGAQAPAGGQFKISRPISSKSGLSQSTNRYGQTSQTLQMMQLKKNEYEQFRDDDDEEEQEQQQHLRQMQAQGADSRPDTTQQRFKSDFQYEK